MTNVALGLAGESYVAKKLDVLGVKYWWNPSQINYYGADFLTNYGIIDVKTAKMQTTKKTGKRFWRFNCHHHGKKQNSIDIFIFIIVDYKDSNHLYFVIPEELCTKLVFNISERQIENGKYSYFLDAWDIIIKTKSRNLALKKWVGRKASWTPPSSFTNYNFLLYTALKEAGLTQGQLSKKTGITESMISSIINGNWNPSDGEKEKIETALNKKVWR